MGRTFIQVKQELEVYTCDLCGNQHRFDSSICICQICNIEFCFNCGTYFHNYETDIDVELCKYHDDLDKFIEYNKKLKTIKTKYEKLIKEEEKRLLECIYGGKDETQAH